jgi:hypothetical protein
LLSGEKLSELTQAGKVTENRSVAITGLAKKINMVIT